MGGTPAEGPQKAALRREERFRGLIEHAPDILAVLDPRGLYAYVSPSFTRILGYAVEEVVGTDPLLSIHAEDVEATAAKLGMLAQRPGMVISHRYRYRHRSGEWKVVESTGSNLLGDPQIAGIVINTRDVTEQVRAEEALRRSEEQLRQVQKLEAIGRLAGGVAHDFNNLLTVIGGNAELVLSQLEAGAEFREEIEEIRAASQRASEFTRQLLAFSRKQHLQPRVMDLNQAVRDLGPLLRRLLGSDIEVRIELAPGVAPIYADPGQMSQVVMNLAVNARDAMPDGGRLEIDVRWASARAPREAACYGVAAGPTTVLTVRDTGSGIDDEVMEHMFEPFYTTKEEGKGTGLGLATVFGIVKQSGGHIRVESEPGNGTAFHVCLPLAARSAASEGRRAVGRTTRTGRRNASHRG